MRVRRKMKYKIKFFGTEEDLWNRLAETGAPEGTFSVRSYALDNTIEFNATEREYLEVCDALGEGVYSEDNSSLGKVLVDFLEENNLVLATAESCTGGLVASRIVDVAGASKVFYEGVVTYSNESKMERLSVDGETLNTYGAVSEQTAKEMAYGLLGENVDIAVSTTGIAGPDGGTDDKPVGLVYIGIAFQAKEPIAIKRIYKGTRNEIRRSAANEAVYRTYEFLTNTL